MADPRPRPRPVGPFDCLEGVDREAAEEIFRNYQVTELEAVNLVTLARLGNKKVLKKALDRIEPRR